MTTDSYEPAETSVSVVAGLGIQHRVTVIFLYGDHDNTEHHELELALDPLRGIVLVDLTDCGFIDSSILAMFLAKNIALKRVDGHLELIVPPSQFHLSRTLDRLGVRTLMPVRATQTIAAASTQRPGDGSTGRSSVTQTPAPE